jgi:hypothetical protein
MREAGACGIAVRAAVGAAVLACFAPVAAAQTPAARDLLGSASDWVASASEQVQARLRPVDGPRGPGMCLDFDFAGAAGYAVARRPLRLLLPPDFDFDVELRGESVGHDLQIKLIDASGENVWWYRRAEFAFPRDWQSLRIRKWQIKFAGDSKLDRPLREAAAIELVVSRNTGAARGSACIDRVDLRGRQVAGDAPAPRVTGSSPGGATSLSAPDAAGRLQPAWSIDPAGGLRQWLSIDLGRLSEFGGVLLRWARGEHATDYDVQLSDDGDDWRTVRRVAGAGGPDQVVLLAGAEARYVRLQLHARAAASIRLVGLQILDPEFGSDPNRVVELLAAHSPRGRYPRGFCGEQLYWTVVGTGSGVASLLSEDGALQVGKNGYTIEPFLLTSEGLIGWADVEAEQSLQDGYLPMPQVHWRAHELDLHVRAFAIFETGQSPVVARYTVGNRSARTATLKLALAVRPLQVDPPTQFLNSPGGLHPIHDLAWDGEVVTVDAQAGIRAVRRPQAFVASMFDAGSIVERLAQGSEAEARSLHDQVGMASGALLFDLVLAPGDEQTVDILASTGPGALPAAAAHGSDWVIRQQEAVAARWRQELGRVSLALPPAGQPIADTLRSALAQILVSRDGARLQPGTHSYARSWIRDGAMMVEALLRMDHAREAADFVRWYAQQQFANGRIPCCVDRRGPDPTPENDSNGEFIFAVTQLYRYTSDRDELAALWPHVDAAAHHLEALRQSERTVAVRADHPELYGLLPASISHEGYWAKPMHSYWDDFWALRGYKDAAFLARAVGDGQALARLERARDEFRGDLVESIRLATGQHRIDFIPGAAELGDFDPTSTTIALAPVGELANLPRALVESTFERYWREAEQRRLGERAWDDYTPYELRSLATFVRLGWRERAMQLLDFFLAGRRPPGWNQWAEVVGREPRKPRFVGDMPHAWIASDFIRSALDLFAYERESDQAVVLAAGVPAAWLAGDGVAVRGLQTTVGTLSYRIGCDSSSCRIAVDPGIRIPPGGIVFEWPGPGAPPPVSINGRPAAWDGAMLRIRSL